MTLPQKLSLSEHIFILIGIKKPLNWGFFIPLFLK